MMAATLEIQQLELYYRSIRVVGNLNLTVGGGVTAVVGPNGSGKTTLLRAVSGLVKPWRGQICFGGREITNLPACQRVRLGVGHVPSGAAVAGRMTVRENLLVGAFLRGNRSDATPNLRKIFDLFPALKDKQFRPAAGLSGGERQMIAIGRALMSNPRLLLLDEPFAGLSEPVKESIAGSLTAMAAAQVPVLLAEHDLAAVAGIAQRVIGLRGGRMVFDGSPRELSTQASLQVIFG